MTIYRRHISNYVTIITSHILITFSQWKLLINLINIYQTKSMVQSILGDPGAVSGGGRKCQRARKNLGEEKSRTSERAPGDKVLKAQFQTAVAALASDWCQKTFFFLPNHRAARLGVVSCSFTRNIHTGQLLAIFVWAVRTGFTREEKFQPLHKM